MLVIQKFNMFSLKQNIGQFISRPGEKYVITILKNNCWIGEVGIEVFYLEFLCTKMLNDFTMPEFDLCMKHINSKKENTRWKCFPQPMKLFELLSGKAKFVHAPVSWELMRKSTVTYCSICIYVYNILHSIVHKQSDKFIWGTLQ